MKNKINLKKKLVFIKVFLKLCSSHIIKNESFTILQMLSRFISLPIKIFIKHPYPICFFSETPQPSDSFNPFDIFDISEVKPSKGSLIIIPTPIGNLRDLSIRQYEALLSVDIIACEDTRITGNMMTLIKRRKLKDQMEDQFGVNLRDLKEEEQVDEGDILSKTTKADFEKQLREEEEVLKEVVANTAPGTDVKDYEQRKKMREELRIKAIKAKAKRVLEGVDSLSFLSSVESTEEGADEVYGLEDDFMAYLKRKIAETRIKKGRGILLSYFKYNEESRINKLIKAMKYGFKIGLVSDAGTPTISDPGYKLVDAALKEGIIIEALPGPSSVAVALSLSGFPSDCYSFEGYLSKTQDERLSKLAKVKEQMMTSVFFESVQRLDKALISIEKVFGTNQMVFIAFEMTKLHQRTYRRTVKEMIDLVNKKEIVIKGEITMIVPPFVRKYNCDILLEKKIDQDEVNLDKIPVKKETEEEKSKVFERDRKSKHEIDENHLMEVLDQNFEITDKDMAEILEEMLKLSKTRSMHIVRKFRSKKEKRSGKILDII